MRLRNIRVNLLKLHLPPLSRSSLLRGGKLALKSVSLAQSFQSFLAISFVAPARPFIPILQLIRSLANNRIARNKAYGTRLWALEPRIGQTRAGFSALGKTVGNRNVLSLSFRDNLVNNYLHARETLRLFQVVQISNLPRSFYSFDLALAIKHV